MADALSLMGAALLSVCGMGWFALAKAPHWQQVRGQAMPKTSHVRALYFLGSAALALSLVLCLVADHVSMASLVWVMLLTGAALVVTFTLAWRPRWLAFLVAWAG